MPPPQAPQKKKTLENNASVQPIMDELLQVQPDIEEFTMTCLFRKILGDPLDVRTIISKTKANWITVRGDVEYHELGNQ